MGAIFQYDEQARNFKFCNMSTNELFLNYNLTLKSAIFKFIIARFDPYLR